MKAMVRTEFRTIVNDEKLHNAALAAEVALRKIVDEDQIIDGFQCHESYVVDCIYRNQKGEWIATVVATKRVA